MARAKEIAAGKRVIAIDVTLVAAVVTLLACGDGGGSTPDGGSQLSAQRDGSVNGHPKDAGGGARDASSVVDAAGSVRDAAARDASTPGDAAVLDGGRDAAQARDAALDCVLPVPLSPHGAAASDAGTCDASLCTSGSDTYLRIEGNTAFYVGALFWIAVVCDQALDLMTQSSDLKELRYPITAQELATLADDSPVAVFYGNAPTDVPPGGTYVGVNCGALDIDDVQPCP